MDEDYWKLSNLDYSDLKNNGLSESNIKTLKEKKYLERPLAYEFYHKLRSLMENDKVDFGDPIVQAEVDKGYQHLFENGKVPDFIIHVPSKLGPEANLAVIEFKLASRGFKEVKEDLKKLLNFRKNDLHYQNLVEVLIGKKDDLESRMSDIKNRESEGENKITLLKFDVETEKIDKEEVELKMEDLQED